MVNASKQKGTRWETDVMNYLRDHGFDVERLALSGSADQGDLFVVRNGIYEVLENKATNRYDIPTYLREVAAEREHFRIARGLAPGQVIGSVCLKLRRHPIGKSAMITTLDDHYGIES
jgi:hypothetical protein